MKNTISPIFFERLQKIIPDDQRDDCLKTFQIPAIISLRVNSLKATKPQIMEILKGQQIPFEELPWYQDALIIHCGGKKSGILEELFNRGMIYFQNLSSLLPVLVLDPKPGEYVWDMCAAPGSKTTQMAAHMKNEGTIVATESVKDRYYRLRSVVEMMGAKNISVQLTDARKLKPQEGLFDRVLIDAPCSSEGRFKSDAPKTFAYWSPRKIKEMVQKQRGLLLSAARLLKPGGILVYSTCTFAPEENEGVVDWLLRKTDGALSMCPIDLKGVRSYPPLKIWGEKEFNPETTKCFRVLPDGKMEGFFMAKWRKETAWH